MRRGECGHGLAQRTTGEDTDTEGRQCVKTQAEVGVIPSHVKASLGPPKAGRDKKDLLLEASEGAQPC